MLYYSKQNIYKFHNNNESIYCNIAYINVNVPHALSFIEDFSE